MKRVGVIGASGFAGFELLKILLKHPGVCVCVRNAGEHAGERITALYPEFGDKTMKFTGYSFDEIALMDLDLVFLALPSGLSAEIVSRLGTKIIDLSGDYRSQCDGSKIVYGLPELFREQISQAHVVANPGCYATACILSAYPLAKHGLIDHAIFDCKSGYSGAGREKAQSPEFKKSIEENILAYEITSHKHLPEIKRFLGDGVYFTPHVLPVFRGLMCTAHAFLSADASRDEVISAYENEYASEKFVVVIRRLPSLRDVTGTNYCLIGGFETGPGNKLTIVSAIDNLVKGAAGQAVQNMNLMLGFEEEEGLS